MNPVPERKETFTEFVEAGRLLRSKLQDWAGPVSGSKGSQTELDDLANEVERYFRRASWRANFFSWVLFISLFLIVSNASYKIGDWVDYVAWLVAVGIAFIAVYQLKETVRVLREIRGFPEKTYRKLIGVFLINIDALCVLFTLALFFYLFPSLDFRSASPLLVIGATVWVGAPYLIYFLKMTMVYTWVRVGQCVMLLFVTLVIIISPVPVRNYQAWARRTAADKFRPAGQHEVTSEWESLRWFSPEGMSLVWYYAVPGGGYRLYSGPGNDLLDNAPLREVKDGEMRGKIRSWFEGENAKEVQGRNAELQRQQSLRESKQAEQERYRMKKAALDAKRIEDERAAAVVRKKQEEDQMRERLIADYVFPGVASSGPVPIVLVVLKQRGEEDSTQAAIISESLNRAGLANQLNAFRPAFLRSPYFDGLLAGKPSPDDFFNPEKVAERILVIDCKTLSSVEKEISGGQVTVVEATLTVRLIWLKTGQMLHTSEIRTRGLGFSDAPARELALKNARDALALQAAEIARKVPVSK